MKRRSALLLAYGTVMARPAVALTPCAPGTRPAVLAMMRFSLLLPDGGDITEAQWTTFRSDIIDPVLRAPVTQRDEPADPARRIRMVTIEARGVSFNPDAPPELPASIRAVMRAWSARFPDASVEAAMLPVCSAS